MNGKEKCKILKEIRTDIARANGIPLEIPECTHKGDCKGTCPRCEAEVKYLEKKLAERKKRGLKIAVAGVCAGLTALSATSCDIIDEIANRVGIEQTLQGDMIVEQDGIMPDSDTRVYTETGAIDGETDEIITDALEGDIVEIPGEVMEEDLIQGAMPIDTDSEGAE